MATSQMSEVIQHIRRAGMTDGQLLEDYISRRDEAALAALVHRHSPMVWGVCRRVLRNYHDAEDAFQATFLVLVRKAASIASRELVANWLYGVAHQTALKARATAAKKNVRERQVTEMPEPAVAEQDLWNDLQPLLDVELSRLPDKYRVVIVLCDLEGKTHKEAARQLGCPEGTVAGQLARARAMLAKRLTQRGVALSGGALAVVLSEKVASAGVPTTGLCSTIKAASLFAAGQAAATGAISVKVAALTEGVMKAMLFTKLKAAIAVVLILGFVATGATILTCRTMAGQDDKKTPEEKTMEPAAKKEKEKEKEKEEVTAWGERVGRLQAGLGFRADDAPKTQDKDLDGDWEVISTVKDGKVKEGADIKTVWTINGNTGDLDKEPVILAVSRGNMTIKATLRIDASKTPKTMDVIADPRANVGPTLDIYSVKGDQLRICEAALGKERPTEFSSKEGSGQLLMTLKRIKK
jgi:RNA polymerase sigma factor (sigma-70 family)